MWRRERDSIRASASPAWLPACAWQPVTRIPAAKTAPPERFLHAASNPLNITAAQKNNTPKGVVFCGGEKGIRTLDDIPAIHDFQSCAFDQLSHLSTHAAYCSRPAQSCLNMIHHFFALCKRKIAPHTKNQPFVNFA